MGIQRKALQLYDWPMAGLRPYEFTIPDNALQHVVSADTGDNWTEGGTVTLDNEWLPIPMSLVYKATDAGNNLDLDITVTGRNQFGERIEEKVTLDVTSGGSTTVRGTKVFARIEKIVTTGLLNNAVADLLDVGYEVNASTLYGLPIKINKAGSGVADNSGNAKDTIKTVFKAGALNKATITVDPVTHAIKDSGPFAADQTIQVVFNEPFPDR